jgi:tetratricopeptide (TPR) repeat protein
MVAALSLMVGSVAGAKAQAQAAGQDAAKPQYTMAEYNAYTAAQATKDPTQQIKQLDDFVSKYPNSALLIYVYPLYYNAYSQLKNYAKVIEYADKLLALGDKIEPLSPTATSPLLRPIQIWQRRRARQQPMAWRP